MTYQEEKLLFNQKTQCTIVQHDGTIKETDGNIFTWKIGTSIYDAHPFFEIIEGFIAVFEKEETTYNFPCIHLEEGKLDKICDITIKINSEEVVILLFDYSTKYYELNKIAQQKNESILRAKELELKNQYLLDKEQFKNSFIANINHEIRTPLTGILGFIEVLEKTNLNFEQEELARIIKRQSIHLNALIEDMVDISKIESGKIKIIDERFLFINLLEGFEETYAKLAEEKGIEFETYIDPNIQEYLIGDRTRVFQILNNILNNAFKFTEEGKVTLSVTKNYQRTNKISIGFKIEDTGLGIQEENLKNIFNRFTRFNGDKQISGTGLGLAIVKDLVDLLNGEIKVTSEPDKGTTFDIKLPFKFDVTKSIPTKKKKKYSLPETKKKFRILVVEDEEATQFLLMKILISHGSFFVDVAINGQEAINYLERRNYDLVLMDLKLSKVDGYKATHMIRNNYGDKMISEVPIIGFTAKATEAERDKCLRSGMDDFIAKPFEQEDLIYKIVKQIAKKAAS
ncbi:response regulator [Aquimarina sp. MMG015]|uniref:ATP-binding response regulator n=1 Tax=unclassified Aquimarina TaxID=2627091 RepID=UPI000E516E9A|nr:MULTISPECIES: ATP-binding protein [unclassified Aquimarina]AXT57611.1 response regulator [Aquimarina sp. AD1]MBQ4805167.1 response regulator [Aquimarina sp. MMG015]RKN28270.1 response regulator [Aquimarina sp. AD1]